MRQWKGATDIRCRCFFFTPLWCDSKKKITIPVATLLLMFYLYIIFLRFARKINTFSTQGKRHQAKKQKKQHTLHSPLIDKLETNRSEQRNYYLLFFPFAKSSAQRIIIIVSSSAMICAWNDWRIGWTKVFHENCFGDTHIRFAGARRSFITGPHIWNTFIIIYSMILFSLFLLVFVAVWLCFLKLTLAGVHKTTTTTKTTTRHKRLLSLYNVYVQTALNFFFHTLTPKPVSFRGKEFSFNDSILDIEITRYITYVISKESDIWLETCNAFLLQIMTLALLMNGMRKIISVATYSSDPHRI